MSSKCSFIVGIVIFIGFILGGAICSFDHSTKCKNIEKTEEKLSEVNIEINNSLAQLKEPYVPALIEKIKEKFKELEDLINKKHSSEPKCENIRTELRDLKNTFINIENHISESKTTSKDGKPNEKDEKLRIELKVLMDQAASYVSFVKKIEAADIFFKHVLKLIFILSGIIGLFCLFTWKAREQREQKEIVEQEKIREWEIQKAGLEKIFDKDNFGKILREIVHK